MSNLAPASDRGEIADSAWVDFRADNIPIVSTVVPFFWLTSFMGRIL